MSRVGKQPIVVPAGVQVAIKDANVQVKGPKGEIKQFIPSGVKVSLDAGKLVVTRSDDSLDQKSLHGLTRARLANIVTGVTSGFTRQLEINGVGYRAEVANNKVTLALGLSHPVEITLPVGIQAKSEKAKSTVNSGQDAVLLTISGIDNEIVGQIASKIRSAKKNEPYKGKGVKYLEEKIRRKVGKTGAG